MSVKAGAMCSNQRTLKLYLDQKTSTISEKKFYLYFGSLNAGACLLSWVRPAAKNATNTTKHMNMLSSANITISDCRIPPLPPSRRCYEARRISRDLIIHEHRFFPRRI